MSCLPPVAARRPPGPGAAGPRLLLAGAALLGALCIGGCAHGPRAPSRPSTTRVEMDPMKIEVVRGPDGRRVEAYDAPGLFEAANADLKAGRHAAAAAAYDRLLAEFPDSRFTEPALYNAGLAYEGLRRHGDAAARYRRLVELRPGGKDVLDALFRLGACLAEEKRWAESGEVFARVLAREDLGLSDRVEAMARLGLSQIEQEQLDAADRTFQDTLAYFQKNEEKERLETDFFLAMSQFYLGNIQHRRFRALPVRLPQRQLEQDVEQKARVFLVAQGRYIETIRRRNPVWASAAGFQIGALYREMYDVLLNAPMPAELDTELKRQVYLDVLKEKLRGLLERAKRIHEKNVAMAERTGTDGEWVKRSGEQLAELERMLEAQGDSGDKGERVGRGDGARPAAPALQPPPAPPPPVPGKSPLEGRPRTVL